MSAIPIENKVFSQPFVVVGVIIEKDNKFLLVQEAAIEKGKWNQPAGWLDLKEDILAGARREAKEETGLDIEVKGLLGVYSLVKYQQNKLIHALKFIFGAKPLTDNISFDKNEILDVKWFTYDEIKNLDDQLRDLDIIKEIEDYWAGRIYPLDVIKPLNDYTQK
ncbi:MAG: NUDIX domain-containing protein [Candidatus Buchananbacteria bacterium]|nr:NUDIX domain-containing protein [Candidatus Buchananbacteria bacterium]